MKKRSIAITMIAALLLMLFSTAAVFAEEDDGHGADAHSGTMSEMEDEVVEEEPGLLEGIVDPLMKYLPYVIGAVCGIIVIVIIVKVIQRSRKPKYTGRH